MRTIRDNKFQISITDNRVGSEDDKNPNFSGNNYIKRSNFRKSQIRGQHGREVMNYSVRSLAAFGMTVRYGRQFNNLVGEFTGRQMRTEQLNSTVQLGTMAVAAAKFGPLGITYAAANIGMRVANQMVERRNENNKADMKHMLSGNNTRGRSRQSGGKV